MKGLSVKRFWNMRPKLPFRFKADFRTGLSGIDDSMLGYAVTRITLPKMEGQASEGSIYLGNVNYTVPVWNIASRKLEISFEETDNMDITKFIDKLNGISWSSIPYKITIILKEYEEHMREENSQAKAFICHLSSYEELQFKRDGQVGQLNISATFIVDTIIDNWDSTKPVITGQLKATTSDKFNPNLDTYYVDEKNEKFKYGNLDLGEGTSQPKKKYHSGAKYKDLEVDKLEVDAAYEKIHDKYSNVTRENVETVQKVNASRMKKAIDTFEQKLSEIGLKISSNAYNDAGHAIAFDKGKASHLLGEKIDLQFLNSSDEIVNITTFTDKQLDDIVRLAKESGLVPNWEKGDRAGWGDFALEKSKSLTVNNEIIDAHHDSWTGEKRFYDTNEKSTKSLLN